VLLLSFGGPEGPDDVLPYLENVTAGRGIPRHRLEAVAEHYHGFGGRSPINDCNRALLAALREELRRRGAGLPVFWGNRNWHPFVTDALREAHDAGARRVLAVVTSAYSSYSGCRQYREDLASALLTLAAEGRHLHVDKIRQYFNTPGFVSPTVDSVVEAVRRSAGREPDAPLPRLLFVTHSIPTAMNEASGPSGGSYVAQHLDVCASVVQQVGERLGAVPAWELVYCSRSGSPGQPWLEPDIDQRLAELAAHPDAGAAGEPARADGRGVVAVPVGFVSDHMEVVYDLDIQAGATAARLDMPFQRAATVGTDPRFVAGLADLVLERVALEGGEHVRRSVTGALGPVHDVCPVRCCRNARADRPAACGEDWSDPVPASHDAAVGS
jgi:ferrochelatase